MCASAPIMSSSEQVLRPTAELALSRVDVLTPEDLRDLARARALLEYPSLVIRIANLVGWPIEKAFELLPRSAAGAVDKLTRGALNAALGVSIATLRNDPRREASTAGHKLFVAATGAIGGAFGFVSLPIELPISTAIMLRAIADVARSEGHDLASPQTKLACLEVFALGGRSHADDAAESSYLAVRAALSRAVSEAAAFIAERGFVEEGSPALVRFVAVVASRLGVIVSEEAAAQAIPLIGAIGGLSVNLLFIGHFQKMARGHFIVKRLEARYGEAVVREQYRKLGARS